MNKITPDNGCCGAQQCKPTQKVDLSRPIRTKCGSAARVIARGISSSQLRTNCDNPKGVLVAVDCCGSDVLYVIPENGNNVGYGYASGGPLEFENVPCVESTHVYINFYHNDEEPAVWEGFDTVKAADDANIFATRSCLIHLTLKRTDGGPWTAEATVDNS